MAVYAYDLVPLRSKTKWTREQDKWLLATYFPGLSFDAVADEAQQKWPRRRFCGRSIRNRLNDIRAGQRNGH